MFKRGVLKRHPFIIWDQVQIEYMFLGHLGQMSGSNKNPFGLTKTAFGVTS